MNSPRFILNSLRYFWKKHLLLLAGVAISGAVITGALMVGDSVQYSLAKIVEQRLGNVSHILRAGDRYFTTGLGHRLSEEVDDPVSTLLLRQGSAVAGGGQVRVGQVQVMGVDPAFDHMAGSRGFFSGLRGDSVILSANLAARLNVDTGDAILLRVEKASLIPLNAPFVSDAESHYSFRVRVKAIAGDEQLGRFNLRVSQTAPFNVFMNLESLQNQLESGSLANVLLFAGDKGESPERLMEAVDACMELEDAGLQLDELSGGRGSRVSSGRVFIDESTRQALEDVPLPGEGILTYFVNSLKAGRDSTPYSFVSTLPGDWLLPGEIIINSWLAEDLGVGAGDSLEMSYFEVGPLRSLNEARASFRIKAVVGMEGPYADPDLMPDLPGLSDAGNCRDWDTGVPISLESIRDKDEDYWDEFGGTPKAFISIDRGRELWSNRFGSLTAYQYESDSLQFLSDAIMGALHPSALGFSLEATRIKGDQAASGGVDFSELFLGLSFFLLVAAVLLAVLLFRLNLGSREGELITLSTMGIGRKQIRRMAFTENLLVSFLGSLAGLLLALVYTRLVFMALNGIWQDVVRTDMMFTRVEGSTLLSGMAATLALSIPATWFPLNRMLRRFSRKHRNEESLKKGTSRLSGLSLPLAGLSAAASMVLVLLQLIRGEVVNAGIFFAAGGLLLLASLSGADWILIRSGAARTSASFSLPALSRMNASRNRLRSMSIVILFAIGAFLVISTGSNRKDLHAGSARAGSGSGGFLYYAESTLPVLKHLDDPAVRYEYSLEGDYSFVQLRRAEGDDASCLNLNKIINPRILGVNSAELEGRFSFVTRTGYLDEERPWSSLQQDLEGGLIPAIADETVIKWGLGLRVGDTLHYLNAEGEAMDLLLIGGLAPSVFQGSVLIDTRYFLEEYPASSGTQVFLVDAAEADTASIGAELDRAMRDLGWNMELAADRLADFYSVTNAYLSIFMVMGALGLLLGIFGLVVVLWRSILERREELAMLRAMGYGRKQIRRLIVREYLFLLFTGVIAGFLSALLATLPSVLSTNTDASLRSILTWLIVLLLNGWFWIALITRLGIAGSSIVNSLRNE